MAFVDLVDAMISESRVNIARLREYDEDPSLSRTQRHAIRETIHTEGLRLDMLQRELSEWQKTAKGIRLDAVTVGAHRYRRHSNPPDQPTRSHPTG